jgi:hypothetical protein
MHSEIYNPYVLTGYWIVPHKKKERGTLLQQKDWTEACTSTCFAILHHKTDPFLYDDHFTSEY